jgi:1,5-anhydro-D-fructose reductase (1,5-anhydro-D-mannitol-forming)
MSAHPRSRLVAVASRDLGRAEAFATAHGAARGYDSYHRLLADPEVDAVLISTPNALHADQVVAAAHAGKHVLCDKPLATTVDDAARAVAACREAGVKLGVNFEFRHARPYRAIAEAVRAGEIGDVLVAHVESSGGIVPHVGWRGDPGLAGLGTTFNIGVHLYDILGVVLDDEVEEVTALLDVGDRAGDEMELVSSALLRFARGTIAYVNASQATPRPLNDVVLHGTRGRIDGRGLGSLANLLRNRLPTPPVTVVSDNGERTFTEPVEDVFERAIAAFADAVLEGRDPDPSGEDGLRSVRVAEAVAESARRRRTVQLAEVASR